MSLFRRISKCVPNSNLQLARTFRPSLVTRITSFLLDISVEATARPFREWYGQGPYMTQGHLQLAHANGGLVPAPDFQIRGNAPAGELRAF
jgi:hypothetical protein